MTTYHPHTQTATFTSVSVDKIFPWHGDTVNILSKINARDLSIQTIDCTSVDASELHAGILFAGQMILSSTLTVTDQLTTMALDITAGVFPGVLNVSGTADLGDAVFVNDQTTPKGIVNLQSFEAVSLNQPIWNGITLNWVWRDKDSGVTHLTGQSSLVYLQQIGTVRYLQLGYAEGYIGSPPDNNCLLSLNGIIPAEHLPSTGTDISFLQRLVYNGTSSMANLIIKSDGTIMITKSLNAYAWLSTDANVWINENFRVSWELLI